MLVRQIKTGSVQSGTVEMSGMAIRLKKEYYYCPAVASAQKAA